ncbi:hypothetical protein ABBQ38_011126 [Trebouxia sp. C0009 RCD-2024]
MAGGSCVPSTNLVGFLNQQRQSDAIVQFLRALAAFYMLGHPSDDLFRHQFDGEARDWSLSKLCRTFVCPHCEGAQAPQAKQKEADVANVIKALSEALQVPVKVGSDEKPDRVLFPDPAVQGSDELYQAAWSDCQVKIVYKPGHFSAAWA